MSTENSFTRNNLSSVPSMHVDFEESGASKRKFTT